MEQLALFGASICAGPQCQQPTKIKTRYGGSPVRYCSKGCASRAWAVVNRERVNELARARHDPEKRRLVWADYYSRNREDLIRKRVEYGRTEAGKKVFADYYVKNREQNLARNKTWRRNNAEYRKKMLKVYGHDRRARELNAPGTYTVEQLTARWDYFGGLCWMCGKEADSVDHVIPLARGGSNWPANLRPACRSCNSAKGARSWRLYLNQKEAA